jgi:aspartokinase-like uncharacterized kinase
VVSDLREHAYTALQAFLPAQFAKYPVELRVVVGHPFERILETAVREHVALEAAALGTRIAPDYVSPNRLSPSPKIS